MAVCNTFSMGAFPATLPEIGRAAALADWQLGMVAGTFGLVRMVSNIPIGLFLTHHLARALLLAPLVLAAGVLLLTTAASFPALVLGRALMGLGHGLGVVAGLTAILRYQTGPTLGVALNAYELSAMLGILGGTVFVGALPAAWPWHLAYLLVSAPQLVAIALVPWLLRAVPGAESPGPRPLFARDAGAGPTSATRVTPLAALAFVAGGAVGLTYATAEQYLIPLRGSREFGLDRAGIARLLVVVQVADILALLPVGRLADRRGAARVVGWVLGLMAVATALVGFGTLPFAVLGGALFGLTMAGWMLPLGVLRAETPPDRIGWRTALYRVCVDGGMFLGPFLSGVLGALAFLVPATAVGLLAATAILLAREGRAQPAGSPVRPSGSTVR
jgi:MFS family permease